MSFGGGGGNYDQKVAYQEQYQVDIQKWKLDWQDMQDAYAYTKESFDIAKWNADQERNYKNAASIRDWEDKEKLRIFDYNNQVDAYNASKTAYNQQLTFNEIAQELAMNDSTRKYNEQLTDIGFQNKDLLMKLRFAREGLDLDQRGVGIDLAGKVGEADVSFKRTKADIATALQQAKDQTALAEKQAKDTTTIEAEQSAQQLDIADAQLTDQLGLTKQQVVDEIFLSKAALKDEVDLSIAAAEKEAALTGKQLAGALDYKKSELAAKGQEDKLANLHQQGDIRNLGQAGRSASKNIQAVLAVHSRANAALTDLLVNEESQYNLSLEKVANTLGTVRAQGKSRIEAERARGVSKLRLTDLSATSQKKLQKAKRTSEEYIVGYRGTSRDKLAEASRKSQLGIAQTTGQTQLDFATGLGGLQMDQARDIAGLSYDKFAQGFLQNIDTAKFGYGQLQESMKSAGAQYQRNMQQTAMDRYSADLAARGRLSELPELPPQLSKPLELPEAQVQAPAGPISWDNYEKLKPVEGVAPRGPSGLSTFLNIIGAVAPFAAKGSDDRFKYDINRVGTSPKGIPEYTFRYRLDGEHGPKYKGTSAQDLIAMGRSDAVVQKEKDGFYYVDYSKLDVEFEKVTAT